MVYDAANGRILLFGGYSNCYSTTPLADTWAYQPATQTWTQLAPLHTPSARGDASMAYDTNRKKVVLFGGWDASSYLNDTWEFDGNEWLQATTAHAPAGRADVSFTYDPALGKVVLLGGYCPGVCAGAGEGIFDEMWGFDGVDWVLIASPTTIGPSYGMSLGYDTGQGLLLSFGGYRGPYNNQTLVNETWVYAASGWQLSAASNAPAPRTNSSLVFDAGRNRMVLYGGRNGETFFNDTWELTIANPTPTPTASPTPTDIPAPTATPTNTPSATQINTPSPTQRVNPLQAAIAAPANVKASDGAYTDKVQVTWNAAAGATSYNVYRAASASGTKDLLGSPTILSFDDTSATPGVTYYYWVKACNGGTCSSFSASDTGWRNLTAPSGVTASDGTFTDKVNITWTTSSGATSYQVYRAANPTGTKAGPANATATTTNDTNATSGVTYYYWVKACRGTKCSDFSASDTGWRNLAHPTRVQASDGTFTDKVQVTWTAPNGATSYKVYRATSETGKKIGPINSKTTSYDDSAATTGLTYYYWVVACRSTLCSDYSAFDTGFRNLFPPINVQASDGTFTDKTQVTWTASLSADSYKVYRAASPTGAKTLLGGSTASPFDDTTGTPGVTYYYWVRACLGENCSDVGISDSGWRNLAAPADVAASDGSFLDKVQITWTASLGATSYQVFRAESESGTKIGPMNSATTSVDDRTGTAGITYFYWVKACRDTTCSDFSAYDTGWRTFTAPTNLQASDGTFTDKVQVTWNAASGATSYGVYRAESAGSAKSLLGSPTGTTFDDSSATPGFNYYYWAIACIGANCSDFSASDTGWRNLTAPANVQASNGTFTNKVQVTWDALLDATSYSVYRADTETGAKTLLGSPAATTFDDTTTTPATNYYYWVIACNGANCSGLSAFDTGWRRGSTSVCGAISANTTWNPWSSPYIATCYLTVASGATLTILLGVEVRFNSCSGLTINGTLTAAGTAENPITFTAISNTPVPGLWHGIYFDDNADDGSLLDNVIIEYGGQSPGTWAILGGTTDWYGNLNLYKASPTIRNSIIRYGWRRGIIMRESAPTISNNSIHNNSWDGIYTSSSNPSIYLNSLYNNVNFGVNNATASITINAEYNWWGDASGPAPYGSGNAINYRTYTCGTPPVTCYDYGAYVDAVPWLTSPPSTPSMADDDGDGLPNDWEINGYDADGDGTIDVDLPAMGADPQHKDLFLEMDYMVRVSAENGLAPGSGVISALETIFSNAPVPNPDGFDGIHLHLFLDDQVTYDANLGVDTIGCSGYDWSEFQAIKDAYFDPNRMPIFHYMIWADNLSPCYGTTSGISRNSNEPYFSNGATDFIVSLGGWNGGGTDFEKLGTLMHELGHNLGLKHGGEDHVGFKPNFLSIMNYSFQTTGLIRNGSYGTFDYSRWSLPRLDENALNETSGINGGSAINEYGTVWYCKVLFVVVKNETINVNGPINWNCDLDSNDTNLASDINKDDLKTILTSQNDWAIVTFSGNGIIGNPALLRLSHAAQGSFFPIITRYPNELTWELDLKLHPEKKP
jgi:fibronectin type 3 domain-containing protein